MAARKARTVLDKRTPMPVVRTPTTEESFEDDLSDFGDDERFYEDDGNDREDGEYENPEKAEPEAKKPSRVRGRGQPKKQDEHTVDKTKRDRFKELAPKRLNRVLSSLKVLGNCGNRSGYEYRESEAAQIVKHLNDAVERVSRSFDPHIKSEDSLEIEFDD